MKEIIGISTLNEAKKLTSTIADDRKKAVPVHCSMCTNCSGIVGD